MIVAPKSVVSVFSMLGWLNVLIMLPIIDPDFYMMPCITKCISEDTEILASNIISRVTLFIRIFLVGIINSVFQTSEGSQVKNLARSAT